MELGDRSILCESVVSRGQRTPGKAAPVRCSSLGNRGGGQVPDRFEMLLAALEGGRLQHLAGGPEAAASAWFFASCPLQSFTPPLTPPHVQVPVCSSGLGSVAHVPQLVPTGEPSVQQVFCHHVPATWSRGHPRARWGGAEGRPMREQRCPHVPGLRH